MTNLETSKPAVSPVWQFVSLLAPTVLTGFYMVYALVGLFVDGQNKLKWSDEALTVGLRVTLLLIVMNALVMLYAYACKVKKSHLLWLSPIAHIIIAILLTVVIAIVA